MLRTPAPLNGALGVIFGHTACDLDIVENLKFEEQSVQSNSKRSLASTTIAANGCKLGINMPRNNREEGKSRPRTDRRFLILLTIYAIVYLLMGEELAEKILAWIGTMTAIFVLIAVADPQWFLGVIVSPMHKHLKETYYDIFAATSQPDE